MKPTPTMRLAVADAVFAAYRAGWNGEMRQRSKRPSMKLSVGRRHRSLRMVTGPTWDGLIARDMMKPDGTLTPMGVAYGEEEYQARHDGKTAQRAAEELAGKEQQEAQAKQEKVDRAKHLFRGLKLSSARSGKSAKVADHITSGGLDVSIFLDDLIAIGEGIEKLR